jgi:hypothetical protein
MMTSVVVWILFDFNKKIICHLILYCSLSICAVVDLSIFFLFVIVGLGVSFCSCRWGLLHASVSPGRSVSKEPVFPFSSVSSCVFCSFRPVRRHSAQRPRFPAGFVSSAFVRSVSPVDFVVRFGSLRLSRRAPSAFPPGPDLPSEP